MFKKINYARIYLKFWTFIWCSQMFANVISKVQLFFETTKYFCTIREFYSLFVQLFAIMYTKKQGTQCPVSPIPFLTQK